MKDDVTECMRAHLELGINTEEFSSVQQTAMEYLRVPGTVAEAGVQK